MAHTHREMSCECADQYRHQKKWQAYQMKNNPMFRQKKVLYHAKYRKNRYAADADYKEKELQRNRDYYSQEAAIRYIKKLFKQ